MKRKEKKGDREVVRDSGVTQRLQGRENRDGKGERERKTEK